MPNVCYLMLNTYMLIVLLIKYLVIAYNIFFTNICTARTVKNLLLTTLL